jgi:hypothetical protein
MTLQKYPKSYVTNKTNFKIHFEILTESKNDKINNETTSEKNP